MAKTSLPAFTQNINATITQFLPADSTNYKTISVAGTEGSRISHITISTNNTTSITAFFCII